MTPSRLPSGLQERYEFLGMLGEGGFGEVLKARDRQLSREVAIKVLRGTLGDLESRQRFEQEARLTSRVDHPHVVGVWDFGISPSGDAWIVYEFVDGGDLADVAVATPQQVQAWGGQIAGALAAVHALGVLHRDLKPQNILLRNRENAVLCDFGVAKASGLGGVQTGTGMVLGTPGYLAPEIFRGQPPSPASDQFGLAATLYEVLFESNPFGSEDLQEIARTIHSGWEAQLPEDRGLPAELVQALRRALAVDPARRFPDLGAMRAGLLGEAVGEVTARVPALASGEFGPDLGAGGRGVGGQTTAKRALPAERGWGRPLMVAGALALALAVGLLSGPGAGPPAAAGPAAEVEAPEVPAGAARLAELQRELAELRGAAGDQDLVELGEAAGTIPARDWLARHRARLDKDWAQVLAIRFPRVLAAFLAWVDAGHPGASWKVLGPIRAVFDLVDLDLRAAEYGVQEGAFLGEQALAAGRLGLAFEPVRATFTAGGAACRSWSEDLHDGVTDVRLLLASYGDVVGAAAALKAGLRVVLPDASSDPRRRTWRTLARMAKLVEAWGHHDEVPCELARDVSFAPLDALAGVASPDQIFPHQDILVRLMEGEALALPRCPETWRAQGLAGTKPLLELIRRATPEAHDPAIRALDRAAKVYERIPGSVKNEALEEQQDEINRALTRVATMREMVGGPAVTLGP